MWTYLFRRLLQTVPVLIGVAVLAFGLNEISGSPVRGMLGQSTTPEVKARVAAFYGFDQPPSRRLAAYLGHLARGDLGVSLMNNGLPVSGMIWRGMQVTVKLALGALIVATFLGLLSGILSAWRPNSLVDYASSIQAALGVSCPAFFLAMLFLLLFAVKLRWFPIGGYQEGEIIYLVLPCLSLGLICTASISRLTRNCMLEALTQDYIRSARAKGLATLPVLLGHAFPNALVPIVTVIGNNFAGLLTGAILTETVYGLPGIGAVIYQAIFQRDLPVVLGCCVFFALVFVLLNLAVDLCYAFLDPRIHYG
jgi:peptide/nickel transport system permease protein